MLLPCMKWSLICACRKVGVSAFALKDCAKKTFQFALSSLALSVVPYQTMPTEPGVGPVSIHGKTFVFTVVLSLTRTGWLQVTPLSVECAMKMSWSFE